MCLVLLERSSRSQVFLTCVLNVFIRWVVGGGHVGLLGRLVCQSVCWFQKLISCLVSRFHINLVDKRLWVAFLSK